MPSLFAKILLNGQLTDTIGFEQWSPTFLAPGTSFVEDILPRTGFEGMVFGMKLSTSDHWAIGFP